MTDQERLAELERAVRRLKQRPKDPWDKAQVFAAFLVPATIALVGFLVSRSSDAEKLALANKELTITEAKLIASVIEPLVSADPGRQILAAGVVLHALPPEKDSEFLESLRAAGTSDIAAWSGSMLSVGSNSRSAYPSPAELDVIGEGTGEWVVQVATATTASEAAILRDQFRDAYERAGQTVWKNDILMVRSPTEAGVWLVVVDTFPGDASEALAQGALDGMEREAERLGRDGDGLGRWLTSATVLRYERSLFEQLYGLIEPLTPEPAAPKPVAEE